MKHSKAGGAQTRRIVKQKRDEMIAAGTSKRQTAEDITRQLQDEGYDISWRSVYAHLRQMEKGD